MNCPKCGASWSTMAGGKTKFHCGSIATNEGDVSPQSELCKDIEHDKKQLVFLRKWREVVLSKVWIDAPEFEPCHWAIDLYGCSRKLEAHTAGNVLVKQAFDAAVRKEMGIAPEAPH